MTTITTQLADALRTLLAAPPPCDCGIQGCGKASCQDEQREVAQHSAREALAAYDIAMIEHRARVQQQEVCRLLGIDPEGK